MERYLPGLDTSLLTDEQFKRKYSMLIYILKIEGKNLPDIKGPASE